MTPLWSDIDVQDTARLRTATAFLRGRLAEPETIDWALRLEPDRQIERAAVFNLLVDTDAQQFREPYATAWQFILESWSYPQTGLFPVSVLQQIHRRLRRGDRSGNLVDTIANFVAPRLEVLPLQARPGLPARRSRRPTKLEDLLFARLTSVKFVFDFRRHHSGLGLEDVADAAFLHAVASALMSEVDRGLYVARRIYRGTDGNRSPMAEPLRVYFVPPQSAPRGRDGPGNVDFEPDATFGGVGPAVKLLHAVVQRMAEVDAATARSFLGRWRHCGIPVYRRLWAAVARNPKAVSATEVREFLTNLDDGEFWDFRSFPEFAELRAVRFCHLEDEAQALIAKRLREGLPLRLFPRRIKSQERRTMKRVFSAMELRRIELGGGILPARERDWLLEAADHIPGLKDMGIDRGFRDPWAFFDFLPSTTQGSRFDDLEGEARLQALEEALSGEAPADQALQWIRQSERAVQVLSELEGAASQLNRFPHVLDHFLQAHSQPGPRSETEMPRDAKAEADRVLGLIDGLSDATVRVAIDGICQWLCAWSEQVIGSEHGKRVWLRAWPFAVMATNAAEAGTQSKTAEPDIRPGHEQQSSEDIDAFVSPALMLLRAFRELFRHSGQTRDPFADGNLFVRMRDCAIAAPGRSGLIARCQLVQELPALLRTDPAWATRHLVEYLLTDNEKSVPLWRTVTSGGINSDVLKIIGDKLVARVQDDRLGRKAQEGLVSCLVQEVLSAFMERREPAVSLARVSQMLRGGGDNVRECAAMWLWVFQNHAYASRDDQGAVGSRRSFQSAVRLFLEQVWPQERFLAGAGAGFHLARLPSVSGEAFAEAVDAVERFLVPLDCQSMLGYGFLEGELSAQMRAPLLSEAVDDAPKARALLRLLDLTVGNSPDAVIPGDLSVALHQMESVAPELASVPAFRRLAAAARR